MTDPKRIYLVTDRPMGDRGAADEGGASLKSGDGDGTSGGMAEESISKRVDFLHTAYLGLVAALVAIVLGFVLTVVNVSNRAGDKVDEVKTSVSTMNRELGVVGAKQDETNARLDRMEAKIDQLVARK